MRSLLKPVTENTVGYQRTFLLLFHRLPHRDGRDSVAKLFLLAVFLLQITAISTKTAPERWMIVTSPKHARAWFRGWRRRAGSGERRCGRRSTRRGSARRHGRAPARGRSPGRARCRPGGPSRKTAGRGFPAPWAGGHGRHRKP